MSPALFFAFHDAVPDTRACLDRVYDVFSPYDATRRVCRQCFTLEEELRIRSPRDVRTADSATFFPIYFEHPNCSGGLSTFRHWLPRALECLALDTRLSPPLPDQIAILGLLRWPQAEQDALRNLFTRATLNWLATGEPAPLFDQTPGDVDNAWRRATQTVEILLSALIYLRIEPASLAQHMLATDTPWASLGLSVAISQGGIPDPTFLVLENPDDEAAMRGAFAALDRRARASFYRVISYEHLMARWEKAADRDDEKLAASLLEAMMMYVPLQLTDQEFTDDEALIAKVVKTCDKAKS